jgi:hypothetical protein
VQLLSYLMMYGADHFITRDLNPEKSEIWFNHKSIVTDSNKDVLMAETIVWLGFLIGRLWTSDKEYEIREQWIRERVVTLTHTNKLLVSIISDFTKVDFHNRAVEGRTLYLASEKERGDLHEVFAGRLITCLENKSLSESPKEINPAMAIMMPIDLTVRLHCAVSIFFATMPQAIYKTFKNAVREYL